MKNVSVVCNGAKPPKGRDHEALEIALATSGKLCNVRLSLSKLESQYQIQDRMYDLLSMAAFIYAADARVTRGGKMDIYGDDWNRAFTYSIPVNDITFWRREQNKKLLTDSLEFLTGDNCTFSFSKASRPIAEQFAIEFKDEVSPLRDADVVIMFSGGIDSLAAVIEAVKCGRRPVLVSHLPTSKLESTKSALIELLKKYYPHWTFPHFSMRIHNANKSRPVEFTQRSRSFLYVSLGTLVATTVGIDELWICDNGIVSLNLPQSSQNIGTMLSRSTHPQFLSYAQTMMREITNRPKFVIRNTLIDKTKKETVEVIAASGHPELLQEAVSCGHTRQRTFDAPHCGTCSQCIDRRFATQAAGMTKHDLASLYRKDIFSDVLTEGDERTYVEGYVRLATELENIPTPTIFATKYPEIYDCILATDSSVDDKLQQFYDLYQRHQKAVNEVLDGLIQQSASVLRRGDVLEGTLLDMIRAKVHVCDHQQTYVKRLARLLCEGFPTIFQSAPPKNEKQLQDAGEGLFKTSRESLYRESPLLPFATITTKPDFSTPIHNKGPELFLEFKYLRDRKRLNGIVTEMSSRVTIYRDQGASVLFVVYDPNRGIVDDQKFKAEFEKHKDIWVGISR